MPYWIAILITIWTIIAAFGIILCRAAAMADEDAERECNDV